MKLTFGKFKGKEIEEIPVEYIMWLAKPKYSIGFYKNKFSTEKEWKVPFSVLAEARKILGEMNYELIGERWEKKGE